MLEELDIMTAVGYFTNLKELTLVHCGLYKIDVKPPYSIFLK